MAEKNIEVNNAKEEILEIIEKCNRCGLCKELDNLFKVIREESISSRGRSILFSKEIFDNSVFDSCLDNSCKSSCPFEIDIDEAVRKARKIMNLKNKENPKNKLILKRILDNKNPFLEDK